MEEYYVNNRPNYKMYAIFSVIPLYLGYCLGKLYGTELDLGNFERLIVEAVIHPIPFRVTAFTPGAVGMCLILYLMVCMYHISTVHNYMPGREYGSARLAEPEELNAVLMDEDPKKNKILSEHLRVSTNSDKTGLNNNTLIIGGSGAGKTFYVVKPNGYNGGSSFIFCDPKIA